MTNRLFAGRLVIGLALITASASAQNEPVPVPADCDHKGVEVHTFYGSSSEVVRSLDRLPAMLSQTRVYAMLLESATSAEVRLYERADAGQFRLSSWKGRDLGDLRTTMDRAMLRTRGLSCAGEELKKALSRQGFTLEHQTVAQPTTLKAAFGSAVERHSQGTLRVSVLNPCITAVPVSVSTD